MPRANTAIRLASLVLLAALSANSVAVTTRTAEVEVKNETGRDISFLRVEHKYSNEFIIWLDAAYILDGQTSSTFFQKQCFTDSNGQLVAVPELTAPCKIKYNTGFGTTGRDWWKVSWTYVGDEEVHYTDPNNLRKGIDKLERYSVPIVAMAVASAGSVAGVMCAVATVGGCAPLTGAAIAGTTAVYGTAIAAITAASTTSGSTAGFKQHILEDEDENKITRIVLRRDGSVVFESSSGTSTTKTSSGTPSELTAAQRKQVELEVAKNFRPSSDWTKVENAGIPGHNQETLNGVGIDRCKVLCELKGWCKSIDHERAKNRCFLQPVDESSTALRRNYPDNPYDHYGFARSAR